MQLFFYLPIFSTPCMGHLLYLMFRCDRRCDGCDGKFGNFVGTKPVFRCKNQNSKKKFRHLHGDLNLDEIKNTLRLLPVNRETNLMNLIMS